jgi:aromatic-L-amino-acid decarboxylase
MDLRALEEAIEADRRAGLTPFLVVGTAGTVDTGAIDDLDALAAICRRERLWFHVDGACGALAMLAPDLAPRLKGIECADSLAFDFISGAKRPTTPDSFWCAMACCIATPLPRRLPI